MQGAGHFDETWEGWREKARHFLLKKVPPHEIFWDGQQQSFLSGEIGEVTSSTNPTPTVNKKFLQQAKIASFARTRDRWDLFYRLLFRLVYENPKLMDIPVDQDVDRLGQLVKSVRHDEHKMHAFVRFKKYVDQGVEHYVAWHKPEHLILRLSADFFVRRFGDRPWSILTPDESAHWDGENLSFSAGVEQKDFNFTDGFDDYWRTYYRSIFNPARINLRAMKREMAPKYWAALPETSEIQRLIQDNPQSLQKLAESAFVRPTVEPHFTLAEVKEKASTCQGCRLFEKASQLVWGEGDTNADLMIVGEQPGDQEDLSGRPFQGPAGDVLRECFSELKIETEALYLTNAVKHFKWRQGPRGKGRIHQTPSGAEMGACQTWLHAEVYRVQPKVIVALGRTAGTSLLGRAPVIREERGKIKFLENLNAFVLVSWHPAALLRAPSPEAATEMRRQLLNDLLQAFNLSQQQNVPN